MYSVLHLACGRYGFLSRWVSVGALGALLAVAAVAVGAEAGGGAGAFAGAVGLLLVATAYRRLRVRPSRSPSVVAGRQIGARLSALESRGWLASGGGGSDHVVHSPRVTFLVDEVSAAWGPSDLQLAKSGKRRAVDLYGAGHESVSVMCVSGSNQRPQVVGDVLVVGDEHLVDLLCDMG